jgi:hypothetical protein
MKETTIRFLHSIILTGAVCAIGWMADAIEMPWLTPLPFVFLLFRAEVRPLLLSHQLVITVLIVIAIGTGVGTFSQNTAIYGSMWFAAAIGLLALNTLLCVVTRLNRERFFWSALVHTAILLVMVGGLTKAHWKQEGMVNLLEGQTGNAMMETEMGQPTGYQRETPFPIRLDDFTVEFYEEMEEVYVYDLNASMDKPSATMALDPEAPVKVGGKTVTYVGRKKQQFAPAPNHPPIEVDGVELDISGTRITLPVNGSGVREGQLGFMFHQARGAPKLYKSKVSVLDDKGKVIKTQEVVVNDPLIMDGWWVYQSSWGESKNGLYSGLQFVRDPGLPYVLIGMTILMIGVLVQLVIPRRRVK